MKRKALQISLTAFLAGCALLLTLTLLGRQTQAREGGILYVAPGGDCGGMSPCYAHPQDAVDAANEGDTIKVATGTYSGIRFRPVAPGYPYPPAAGLLRQVAYISKTLTLRGGYATTDWEHADPEAHPTTLDAQGQGRVLFIAGEITTTVEGLHITGGTAEMLGGDPWESYDAGGGAYVMDATVTLRHCRVSGNGVPWIFGGGMYLYRSDATLTDNTISSNRDGGLALHECTATLTDNTISSNTDGVGGMILEFSTATLSGNTVSDNVGEIAGALYVIECDVTLIENTIRGNSGGYYSGGVWLAESEATLIGNTISSNVAQSSIYYCDGGGLLIGSSSDATLIGNTITGNIAGDDGGGLLLGSDTITLTGNIISGNWAGNNGGGLVLGAGTITLSDNTITGNTAGADGGGLRVGAGTITLNRNIISANRAKNGGGLDLDGGQVTLSDNAIAGNTAQYDGGGVAVGQAEATFDGNTIAGNSARDGGGVGLWSSDATLTNDVIMNNGASSAGGGLYVESSSPRLMQLTIAGNGGDSGVDVASGSAWLTNTILVSHTLGVYTAVGGSATLEGTLWYGNGQDTGGEGAILTGTVNVYGDPAFVDASGGDYHIGAASAAIDVGVDAGVSEDMEGDGRPFGYGVDIGADEYVGPFAPRVGGFEPQGGSGRVGQWVEFTTTATDPNGYEDIAWAFLFLDREPPIASGGLAAAYYQPVNILWLMGGGVCRPGQAKSLSTAYVRLDCARSSVSGADEVLTVTLRVRPEQCFEGGCGWNTALGFVMDGGGLQDAGLVGWWRLDPASGPVRDRERIAPSTEADGSTELAEVLEWLKEEIGPGSSR